jgi:DNA-binding MarR family transcriptional regulator
VSRDSQNRAELLAVLNDEFQQLSTATILFHQAIADSLGMNVTDHKCAGILMRSGPITAGELAQHTGLTTGAITGVIDRLEKAGFVRRTKDANDRRRVIIEPILKQIERAIGPLFESMAQSAAELCASYSTDELAVIRDFTVRSRHMAIEETRKLREAMAGNTPSKKKGVRKKG